MGLLVTRESRLILFSDLSSRILTVPKGHKKYKASVALPWVWISLTYATACTHQEPVFTSCLSSIPYPSLKSQNLWLIKTPSVRFRCVFPPILQQIWQWYVSVMDLPGKA